MTTAVAPESTVVVTTAAVSAEASSSAPRRRFPWRDDRTRFLLVVGAAVLVGLVLRILIGLTDDSATTDETAYLRSGMSLVNGDGFVRDGRPELHFPPLVPFLLGLGSRAFDDPHTGMVFMTVVAGTLLIVPLTLLGRRIAGPSGGMATAWVAALAPGLATLPQVLGTGSEAEYTLLVVTAVWLVVSAADRDGRGRLVRISGAGLAVGLAYLTRPEGLLIAVPLSVGPVVACWRIEGWRARIRPTAATAAAFSIPLIVCIAPYTAYLHEHTGSWQLTAKTQDASIEAWAAVARGDRRARNEVLYALDDSGVRLSADRASLVSLARDDPSGYVGIVWANVGALGQRALDWRLLPFVAWLLAAYGAWRHRRSRVVVLTLAVGVLPVATALAFFVQPRYLLVTVALATVLAGAGLAVVPQRARRVAAVVLLALLAVPTVLSFRGEVAGWWHPVEHTDQRRAGEWIAAHTDPDDRIMTRSMVVELYAGRPTVALPHGTIDEVLRFGRHYGAQYLVADWYTVERLVPQLRPLAEDDEVPGLRLVHEVTAEGRTVRIFALDPPPPTYVGSAPSLSFTGDG